MDFTLILVFFLVATGLGNRTLPAWHPDWSRSLVWAVALGAAVLFFASVLAHELSHALVARARGMRIAGITLFMFGGVTELVGEPPTAGTEFLMAIVGPLTSIGIGLAAILGANALVSTGPEFLSQSPEHVMSAAGPAATLLIWLGPINVMLGIFNLIPGFPLDGGRVLRSLLWGITRNLEKATIWAAGVGQLFAWLLIAAGVFIVFGGGIPFFGRGPFQGLWLVLIGWFLSAAAQTSAARVVATSALRGVPVRDLVVSHVEALDPDDQLEIAVRKTVQHSDQTCFPVLSGGKLVGVVGLREMQAVSNRWADLRVRDVMLPANRVPVVEASSDAGRAVDELARREPGPVAVQDEGHFVGFLRRQDVLRWLALHPKSAASSA